MAKLMPTGKQQYFDSTGNPLNGGKVYTFAVGTNTPKVTYSDAAGTVPNANPVILDSRGEALIFWDGAYDIQVKDANNNLIYSVQSYSAQNDAVNVSYGGASLDSILKESVVNVVTSISALRGLDKLKNTKAFVTGYYAGGDGGGGDYYYDSSDTTSADNGGTVIVASDGGRWKLSGALKISARTFGAKGDGSAGDTAAFNRYLAWCASSGNDALIDDGTFFISRLNSIALASGTKLTVRGVSRDSSILKVDAAAYTGNTNPILAITGSGNVVFRDVTFDQNWIETTYPAGHSYADNAKASTWGGGSWVFDINTTGNVEFENCGWLNTFRGAIVKNAKRLSFCRNRSDSTASIGQTIVAAEDCGSVVYHRNSLLARDWSSYPGYTGASGLFGISCDNVQISNNWMQGHQLVFHGTTQAEGGYGHRIQVTKNMIITPPADTAFYRWYEAVVTGNLVQQSGDMGIAVSDSSYITVTGNTIAGTHVGGIGLTNCKAGVVSANVIKDIAQNYSALYSTVTRYPSNAGTWLSGIVTDYQSGGAQSKGLAITGNTLWFDTLPPVSDANGPIRSKVFGILFDTTTNTASQNTGVVTGNFLYQDAANLPKFKVSVPTYRFYLAGPSSRVGTPIVGETFANGGTSFRLLVDYGDGNLVFIDKLVGTIGAATAYTGQTSGAVLVSANPLPQLTFLNCIAANNIDSTVVA